MTKQTRNKIDTSASDIPVDSWVDRFMPRSSHPYIRLARFDRREDIFSAPPIAATTHLPMRGDSGSGCGGGGGGGHNEDDATAAAQPVLPSTRGEMSQVAAQAAATGAFLKSSGGGRNSVNEPGTTGVLVASPIHISIDGESRPLAHGAGLANGSAGVGIGTGVAPPAPEVGQHTLDVFREIGVSNEALHQLCLLYTSPSPRDRG